MQYQQVGQLSVTRSQSHIVDLLVKGYTSKEIARELFLSVDTVRTHIRNILVYNNLRNRTEIAIAAVDTTVTPQEALVNGQRVGQLTFAIQYALALLKEGRIFEAKDVLNAALQSPVELSAGTKPE